MEGDKPMVLIRWNLEKNVKMFSAQNYNIIGPNNNNIIFGYNTLQKLTYWLKKI